MHVFALTTEALSSWWQNCHLELLLQILAYVSMLLSQSPHRTRAQPCKKNVRQMSAIDMEGLRPLRLHNTKDKFVRVRAGILPFQPLLGLCSCLGRCLFLSARDLSLHRHF